MASDSPGTAAKSEAGRAASAGASPSSALTKVCEARVADPTASATRPSTAPPPTPGGPWAASLPRPPSPSAPPPPTAGSSPSPAPNTRPDRIAATGTASPAPGRRPPGASAPTSLTWRPTRSSSSTTPSSRPACPCGSRTATAHPPGLAPLLLVPNNMMMFAPPSAPRYGTTTEVARKLLLPLCAPPPPTAPSQGICLLTASAAPFPWPRCCTPSCPGNSPSPSPDPTQGPCLGVHGLAQSGRRSLGPLAVTAAIDTGPLGWAVIGAPIALTCALQHRLVRDRLQRSPLSVPPVTLSEH